MKIFQTILKIAVIAAVFLFFTFSLPSLASAAGLVPDCEGAGCNFCHAVQLGKNVIDKVMLLFVPLITVMVVIGGGFIMFSMGSSEKALKGKKIITAALAGFAIALFSWLILDTIFKVIVPDFEQKFGAWNQIQCK